MKARLLVCLLAMSAMAASIFAVPYASQIRVGALQLPSGAPQEISYFINEAGGTATIEVLNAVSSAVAATFAGTADLGLNTVNWDGTVDNAGGATVPNGDYRVQITVDKTAAAGWAEISSHQSVGNYYNSSFGLTTVYNAMYDGYSGMEMLITHNPDLDSFGIIKVASAYSVAPIHGGHVDFNPDLSVMDGADGSDLSLNFPLAVTSSQAVWGNSFDPEDPTQVWVCGQQGANNVMHAGFFDETLVDVTNGNTNLSNSREIAVQMIGETKYAFVTRGNSGVWRADVTSGQVSATAEDVINILGLTNVDLYSKGVDFDSDGNMYWTSRYDTTQSSGEGGVVYRWDAALVAAATAGSLTEANSTWEVTFPDGASNAEGVAIAPNGDVYAAVMNEGGAPANDGSLRGIYLIGNTSQASNVKQLTVGDRVIPWPLHTQATVTVFSGFGTAIEIDLAGNIYYSNRSHEHINVWGPGGTTSVTVPSPLSQIFTYGLLAANDTWALYE